RPIVVAGAVAMAIYAFALFPMVDSGSAALLTVALVRGQAVIHPMMYGPLAALSGELFGPRARSTGPALGHPPAGPGAGLAPVIFAQVQAMTGGGSSLAISAVIAAFCVRTVVCMRALAETSRKSLADVEAAAQPTGSAAS